MSRPGKSQTSAPVSAAVAPAIGVGCRFWRNLRVPMRDDVTLATTVMLPPTGVSFPVVLVRTAYNRAGIFDQGILDHGMALVVQDCRGRYDSPGEHLPFVSEDDDGADTIAWLKRQPWCNGRIGMYGDSYLAATQFAAARAAGAELSALNPRFMSTDCWQRAYYCDGVFSLGLTWSWLCFECTARVSEASMMPRLAVAELLRHLPLLDLDERSGGGICRHYRDYLQHNRGGEFWRHLDLRGHYHSFTMPVLATGGWYDNYAAEAVKLYRGCVDHAQSPAAARRHRLLIGPWTHGINGSRVLGEVDFGEQALAENGHTLRWLESVLVHDDPERFSTAPVRLFVMGRNCWRDFDDWPPPGVTPRQYYLHDGGVLKAELPATGTPDSYTYDPEDPVPTRGGNHSVGTYNPGLYELALPGPYDQRSAASRQDVLVYATAPLTEDLTVIGHLSLRLFAASSARDTDFVARLVDIHPEGSAINISEGVIRARFRNDVWGEPELLTPHQVYAFNIDLQVTATVFKAGHCLGLHLTSSNFPLWDRNLNTGNDPATDTEPRIARQTIYHDREHPSHLILPVLPA